MEIKKIDKDLEFLKQVSKEVDFKSDLTEEINELEQVILDTHAFAIAAVQYGYLNRVIYVRCSDESKVEEENYNEKEVLINPVITKMEGLTTYWEACLSCLDNMAIVCRPYKIHIEYYDINGNKKEKVVEGFPSTVLSHEYDHLNGILHMDKSLEVLNMKKEERKEFRKNHPYEILSKEGDYNTIMSNYQYDPITKRLVERNNNDN